MKKIIFLFILVLLNIGTHWGQSSTTGTSTYRLKISGRVNFEGSTCGDNHTGGLQWIALQKEMGSVITLIKGTTEYPNDAHGLKNVSFSEEYDFTKSNKVKKILYHTTHRSKGTFGCKSVSRKKGEHSVSDCMSNRYDFKSSPLNLNQPGYANIEIYPIVDLQYPSEENRFITEDDFLTITLQDNLDNQYYNWEYSVADTYNFKTIPSVYNNKAILKLRGKDFLNNEDFGKNIYIRVNMGNCAGSPRRSNNIFFGSRKSAPQIIKIEPTNPKCPGDANGSARVYLDRALLSGEKLAIYYGPLLDERVDIESLDAENSFVINSLSNGTYPVQISGFYNGVQMYSDGEKHKDEVLIKDPDPVSFQLEGSTNILCYGETNGSLRVSASGGAGGYKVYYKKADENDDAYQSAAFSSPSETTITGLEPDEYEFYVEDENGCYIRNVQGDPKTLTKTLTAPENPLEITRLADETEEPSGNGRTDGYITIFVEGGTPLTSGGYNAVWKNKSTGETIGNIDNVSDSDGFKSKLRSIPAGVYTVDITDDNGCTISEEFTLDEPNTVKVKITQTRLVLCTGDKTASLSASASGGIPSTSGEPYTYKWYKMNSSTDSTYLSSDNFISGLEKGIYKVIAGDASNSPNKGYAEFEVKEPVQLKASFTSYHVSCRDGSNGSIKVDVSDGTHGYTLYCKKEGEAEKTLRPDATGKAFNVTGLSAGKYTFYVKDVNGCLAQFADNKKEGQVTLTEPDTALEIVSRVIEMPSGAERTDGSITVKIKGGVPHSSGEKYHVVWKNSSGGIAASSNSTDEEGLFTSKIENLAKGTYTVSINDAGYSGASSVCYVTSIINVDEPKPLTVSLSATRQVDCNGSNTAQITAIGRGGVTRLSGLPYIYTWYKIEDSQAVLIENENDSILNNIGIGSYKVEIEDGSSPSNIKESLSLTITQPNVLETEVSSQNISCFEGSDGKIVIKATGGVPAYKMFYREISSEDQDYSEISPSGGTFALANLKAGTYSVYIKDSNDCYAPINDQEVAEITLTQPEKPVAIISQIINPPTGARRSDGTISLGIEGGTPNDAEPRYHVVWKNESGQTLSSDYFVNEDGLFFTRIQDLAQGLYTVEIKDKNYQNKNNGCYVSTNINLKEPEPLAVSLELTETVDCFGFKTGKLVAHVQGGVTNIVGFPYTYKWYEVVNGSDKLIFSKNDSILSNIGAGSYKVFIEDGSSVVNTIESDIFEIIQPTEQKTEISVGNISCYNGSDGFIRISVSGGTGKHRMFLKRIESDNQYREVTPDNTSHYFAAKDLPAGTYSVYIFDENDCYAAINGQQIAHIIIKQADTPLSVIEENVFESSGYNKQDGEISLIIAGGLPLSDGSYIVVWKDSVGNILQADNSVEANGYKSVLSKLREGRFIVEIRDANYDSTVGDNNAGCLLIKEYELIEPEELEVYIEQTWVVSCNGMTNAQLIAHAGGGVPNAETGLPYKYKWYKQTADTYLPLSHVPDSILDGAGAGSYRVEIEDYSRKANTVYAVYSVVEPEKLQAATEDVHVECGQTARISVEMSGGTLPYTYQWNTGDTLSYMENAHPGRYMVYIQDARGCDITASVNVISPGNLNVTGKISDPVCADASNGSIVLNVTGGTGPYTYSWSNGATTKDLINIPEGIYTVVVTEQGGCTFSESFNLTDPEALSVYVGEDALICLGQSHKISPEVDDPNTQFVWTGDNGFESKEKEVELSLAGTYSLTITDSKGCQASDEMTLRLTDYGISSEMVVATDVFVKDTVVFVNISHPEPDKIEWIVPEDIPARVVSLTEEMLQVVFDQTGDYSLGMRAHVKDCFQDVMKTITVTNGDNNGPDNFGQTDIKEFSVYPNPNGGKFNVKIVLNKEVSVRLRMFSLNKGGLIDNRIEKGSKEYNIQYDMVLSAGVYVLLLETPSGRKSIKIAIR